MPRRYDFSSPQEKAPEALPYAGFYPDGGFARSAAPFHNAVDRFARRIVPEMRQRLLSPADVLLEVSRAASDDLSRCFALDAERWCRLDRYYLWGCATGRSAVTTWIGSFGCTYPWTRDENAWAAEVDEACRRHGYTMPSPEESQAQLVALLEQMSNKIGGVA